MSIFRRSRLQSPKYIEKRRKKIIGMVVLFVFALITFTFLFILLMRAPFFNIKNVEVAGSDNLSKETIKNTVLSSIQGRYLAVIPQTNIFFFPKAKVEKMLLENFKNIESADLKRNGFSQITVYLKERTPAAIVCSGFHEQGVENNDCYFSDKNGYVYSKANEPYPDYNRYYVSPTRGNIVAGAAFIDQSRFQDLQKFVAGSLKGGIVPLGVLVGDNGEYEMYIHPDTTVYFDDLSSFDETLSNLLAFWQNAKDKAKTEIMATSTSSTPSFDYINLRFGNTIYYSTNNAKRQ